MLIDQNLGGSGISSRERGPRRQGRSGAPLRRHRRRVPAHRPPFRRGARRLGDGRVRRLSSAAPRRRACGPRARGSRRMSSSSPAAIRSGWARRRARGRRRRGGHRHQHGLPGEARDRRLCRLGADARSRPRAPRIIAATVAAVRRAGHRQDAARLGRGPPQRAGACRPRRGARRRRRVTVHGRTRQQFYKGARRLGRASPRS